MTKNGNKRGDLTALAKKAGISPTYLFEIEMGKKVPPLLTAARIYATTGKRFGALAHPDVSQKDAAAVVRVLRRSGQIAA